MSFFHFPKGAPRLPNFLAGPTHFQQFQTNLQYPISMSNLEVCIKNQKNIEQYVVEYLSITNKISHLTIQEKN